MGGIVDDRKGSQDGGNEVREDFGCHKISASPGGRLLSSWQQPVFASRHISRKWIFFQTALLNFLELFEQYQRAVMEYLQVIESQYAKNYLADYEH